MIFGTSIAILTSVFPPNERGKVLGITTAVVYVGLSIGPFIGGVLTTNLGWRSLFLVLLPLGAAILYVGHIKLKGEWAEAKGEKFDFPGSIVYALALSFFIIGFSLMPQTTVSPLIVWTLTAGGGIGILLFVLLELRSGSPVLDMSLFRSNRAFAYSNLAALINYAATFAVGFLMSLYLQYILGMDPQSAGIILVSQPIVMAVFSPLAGRRSDTVEPRLLATIGMAISAVGLVFFALLTESTGIPLIVGCLAFIGFGFALFSSPNTNAIMSSVERKQYGIASASVGTMRLIGQAMSLGIASVCISLFLGPAEVTPALRHEFLQGFQLAFSVFAVMCFVGVFASFARGNVRDGPNEQRRRGSGWR
jgi:MFS family permease